MYDFQTKGYNKYGADMGRRSIPSLPHDTKDKCIVRRVRLDSGGYDAGGAYWGVGTKLWMVESVEGEHEGLLLYVRAFDKSAAKAQFPAARWGR